jgi:tetratricopeptide (TPR) repeat protein
MRIVTFTRVCCLTLTLLFSGCSPVINVPNPVVVEKDSAIVVVEKDSAIVVVEKDSATQDARKAIERLLAEGSLVKAHDALRDALGGDATETSLVDVYTQVENRLLGEAARAEGEGHFDTAGRFYRMALGLYPKSSQLRTALVMTEEAIKLKIDECADELMKSGLVAYREGDLAEAVAVWEKITPFYPDYSPSKIAINTAKKQIENLERLAPDKAN